MLSLRFGYMRALYKILSSASRQNFVQTQIACGPLCATLREGPGGRPSGGRPVSARTAHPSATGIEAGVVRVLFLPGRGRREAQQVA